ncbi:PEGA domain-containing protein [Myxococcus sp. K15C18031901]|uniref:PEGA domain-containing protein n=1 Tax=Myxococcus dinghuensis TaxID=2906761 RepID=UPI0020A79085|nr:PEGA domain-containing protein [Myxococcus dinghuensis]MCP3103459.1 PEGA domain-containing protein [Myxococcus dinghuensis]
MSERRARVTRWVLVSLVLCATPAIAQQAAGALDARPHRPWAEGVSAEDQRAAEVLFLEGNGYLRESVFVEAIRSYRRALGHWNHPAIHYNLALALMNLDQPLEVHKHLRAAMDHGAEPLDAARFEHARAYQALIEKQLAWVDVRCDEEGAVVTLNGQPLFKAPGRYRSLIRPGVHSVVALKEGYLPTETRQTLKAGETAELRLALHTANEVIRYRRRWSAWVPWTVLGAGLAVGGAGALLHVKSKQAFDDFDSRIPPEGTPLTPALSSLRRRGSRLQGVAIGAYSLAGATLVTGAVMAYLNRRESYRIQPEPEAPWALAPILDTEAPGVLGFVRF